MVKDLTELHARFRPPISSSRMSYAGFSDGRTIFVHAQPLLDADLRTWEILHLTGHIFQWHMSASVANRLNLEFYASGARRLAEKDFASAAADELTAFLRYELETNRLSIAIANSIAPPSQKVQLQRYLTRYCAADLAFILEYYASTSSNQESPFIAPDLAELEKKLSPVPLPTVKEMCVCRLPFFSVPVLLPG